MGRRCLSKADLGIALGSGALPAAAEATFPLMLHAQRAIVASASAEPVPAFEGGGD